MQFIVISDQLISALWALFLGCFFAACYDAVRVIRMILCADSARVPSFVKKLPSLSLRKRTVGSRISVLIANVFDVLYSLFAASAFCIFVYYVNNGRFRWYLLFCCAVGFVLYRLSAGRLTVITLSYAAGILRHTAGFAVYIATRPAVLIYRLALKAARPAVARIKYSAAVRRTEKIRKALPDAVRFR